MNIGWHLDITVTVENVVRATISIVELRSDHPTAPRSQINSRNTVTFVSDCQAPPYSTPNLSFKGPKAPFWLFESP